MTKIEAVRRLAPGAVVHGVGPFGEPFRGRVRRREVRSQHRLVKVWVDLEGGAELEAEIPFRSLGMLEQPKDGAK